MGNLGEKLKATQLVSNMTSEGYITGILLMCLLYWGDTAALSKQGKNPTPEVGSRPIRRQEKQKKTQKKNPVAVIVRK
jgi:hypothetical protein